MNEQLSAFISDYAIETVGTVLSLIYLYLSIKQKVSLWVFGFLSAIVYAWVFFDSKFYGAMTLQLYYLGVSIYGWISWKKAAAGTGEALPVKNTSGRHGAGLTSLTIIVMAGYYAMLTHLTDSPYPLADAFATALSITATWMLARKRIEHWIVWIVVDVFSVGLYIYYGLYPTALLFVVYTIMAFVGWREWNKTKRAI